MSDPEPASRTGAAHAGYHGAIEEERVVRTAVAMMLVVAVAAACGSEPPTEPLPEPVVYVVDGFRIEDATREAPQALIDSIAAALGDMVPRVEAFLPEFTLPDDTITFRLLPGGGIPFVTPDALLIVQWVNDLALDYLPHQITHLLTGYDRRVFLEEGIAVYVTEALEPASTAVNPYRGQPPHAWVSLYESNRSTIPLATVYTAANLGFDYAGSSADASAWQVFIEAGSFTRWVFEAYGRSTWLELYDLDDPEGVLGAPVDDLERAWLTVARTAFPTPLACEDALATRGALTTREEFWCARARGE